MQIPLPQDTCLVLANRSAFPCQQIGLSGQLRRRHGTLFKCVWRYMQMVLLIYNFLRLKTQLANSVIQLTREEGAYLPPTMRKGKFIHLIYKV